MKPRLRIIIFFVLSFCIDFPVCAYLVYSLFLPCIQPFIHSFIHSFARSFIHSFILSFLQFHVESINQQLERNTPDAQCYMLKSYYSLYVHTLHIIHPYIIHIISINAIVQQRIGKTDFVLKFCAHYDMLQYNTKRYDVESTLANTIHGTIFTPHSLPLRFVCVCVYL